MSRARPGLAALLPLLAWAAPALAGSVTVVNGGSETIRSIQIAPSGGGENRLRSTLPPGASARITYSTGCQAVVRLGYDGGRTEEFASVDPCTDPRVVAGQGTAAAATAPPGAPTPTKTATAKSPAAPTPAVVKAPPPVVPPWTGKSITKRFGGMD